MAGIDKTYCKSWEDYQEVSSWCKENKFTCPNGIVMDTSRYVYCWEEGAFNGEEEIPIMNTPQAMDYFLIKYCPIKLVQDRMLEVYDKEYVDAVKGGTSEYDKFVYPEVGTGVKLAKESRYHNRKAFRFYSPRKNKMVRVLPMEVEYNGETMWYNEGADCFLLPYELGVINSSDAITSCGSIKAMVRRIKKWKLPKGAIVTVTGHYVGEIWKFKIV